MNHLRNRVISQADLDYLQANRIGLFRRAKVLGWRVATAEVPANLTLADFGIEQPPIETPSRQEYLDAGYAPEGYDKFVADYAQSPRQVVEGTSG